MNVFSNTTPFIALSSIEQLPLMHKIFGRIYIAESVYAECMEGGPIRLPDLKKAPWITVLADDDALALPVQFELDSGEKQTIALALKHRADMVIMDERIGRRVAEYFGLRITGTLGILLKARVQGLIPSFHDAAMAMRKEGIYFNPVLVSRLAAHVGEKNT